MPSATPTFRDADSHVDVPLNVLFPNAGIFVWGMTCQLGKVRRDLLELKRGGLLCNEVEAISQLGYRHNYGIGADETLLSLAVGVLEGLLARCRHPRALVVHHSYALNTSLTADSEQTGFMSWVQYFPAALMRELRLDHIPYLGSFASGCTGLLSLLLTASSLWRNPGTEPVICLTADVKPPGSSYDALREKILTSDCCSGFLLGRDQCGYQLLGISYYSTTRMLVPLVEVVKRTVRMVRSLAKDLDLDLVGNEVVMHYPNIFPAAWAMVTQYLQVPPECHVMDGLAERAHCLSSDPVISLAKQHCGRAGRPHVVVNFGSGLHLGVCILREEENHDPSA
jgi:hypothetical protein